MVVGFLPLEDTKFHQPVLAGQWFPPRKGMGELSRFLLQLSFP